MEYLDALIVLRASGVSSDRLRIDATRAGCSVTQMKINEWKLTMWCGTFWQFFFFFFCIRNWKCCVHQSPRQSRALRWNAHLLYLDAVSIVTCSVATQHRLWDGVSVVLLSCCVWTLSLSLSLSTMTCFIILFKFPSSFPPVCISASHSLCF